MNMSNLARSMAILIGIGCLLAVTACSTRRVYETAANRVPVAPDAININTATADELERLPYIGHKTAEAIVEFRTVNGPFRRPEHLMQIRGVSETRFAELSPYIKTE
jgi:competence protein ComEA